jgi:uncharacterized protein
MACSAWFWRYLLGLASSAVAFVVAVAAGAFGSVLGIGGGLFIVPSLSLFLGVKLKTAIATSIVAVIATSMGGGNVYLRRHIADLRVGLVLALATAPTAVIGALLAIHVDSRILAAIFALVLFISGFQMLRSGRAGHHLQLTAKPQHHDESNANVTPQPHPPSQASLRGQYFEESTGALVGYQVQRVPLGVAASGVVGLVSGLLGVGGGIVQVPVMNLIMKVPIKVATATSTYIIGITAMAGAFVYYNQRPSLVDPALAVAASIGVFIGASIGSNLLGKVSQKALRNAFTVVLGVYAVQMILRVFGIGGG